MVKKRKRNTLSFFLLLLFFPFDFEWRSSKPATVCVFVYSARLRLGIFNFVLFSGIKESASRETTLNRSRQLKMLLHHNHQKMVKHLTCIKCFRCWWVIFWFIHPVWFNHVCKFSPIFVRDVSKSSWEKNVRIILFFPLTKKCFVFLDFKFVAAHRWRCVGGNQTAVTLSLYIYIPLSRTIGDAFDLLLNTYTHSQRITKHTKLLYSGKRRLMGLKQKEMATTIAAAVQHYLDDY